LLWIFKSHEKYLIPHVTSLDHVPRFATSPAIAFSNSTIRQTIEASRGVALR